MKKGALVRFNDKAYIDATYQNGSIAEQERYGEAGSINGCLGIYFGVADEGGYEGEKVEDILHFVYVPLTGRQHVFWVTEFAELVILDNDCEKQ